jgi:hypothetical protein
MLIVLAGVIVLVASLAFGARRFRTRRPDEQGFDFVYVNQDGSARELSPDERVYLSTEFMGADGGRPYIKDRYESRDGWGSLSGFISRRLVPSRIPIEAVNPEYDSTQTDFADEMRNVLGAAGLVSVTNADGSIEYTRDSSISGTEGFERMRDSFLAAQRRREELAKGRKSSGSSQCPPDEEAPPGLAGSDVVR